MAYALDRTLRTKGSQFPLIGIFPERLDRSIVPSAIATRLYVDLKDAKWSQVVADALTGRNTQAIPAVPAVHAVFYEKAGRCKLEIRPRDGHWYPARTLVPESEFDTLAFVYRGPPDKPDFEPSMFQDTEISGGMDDGSRWKGRDLHEQIDHTTSLYVILKKWPTSIVVGGGRDIYRVYPDRREVIKIPVVDGKPPWH